MFNKLQWSTFVLFGALASPYGYADVPGSALDTVENTVMGMLASETRIAANEQAQRERKALGEGISSQSAQPARVAPMETPSAPQQAEITQKQEPVVRDIQLVGIYGLRETLTAEVRIDGETLRFQRGLRYPKGYGTNSPYTLISINTPCVKYVEKGAPHTVCIDGVAPN